MIPRSGVAPIASALLLASLLAGCQQAPQTRAQKLSAAAAAACRQRADQVYEIQNRGMISERDQRDNPFSSTGLPGITSAGLGLRFGRDQMVANCEKNSAAAAGTQPGTAQITPGTSPAMSPSAPGVDVPMDEQ